MSQKLINSTYLPFNPEQLLEHFAPVRSEASDSKRHLKHYLESAIRYHDFLANNPDRRGITLSDARYPCQIEKDERYWVVTCLMNFYHNPERVNYFAPPKTKAGKRKVVLGGKTIEKLREHRERQQIEREIIGDRWQDFDLIFPSKKGTPMDRSNLLKDFKKLIKEAGLPEIRFHDLRHTAASLMLNNRVDVLVASRRLGHSKPSVTLDIYGHLMPGMQHEAADIMDELVTPVEFRISHVRINDESLLVE